MSEKVFSLEDLRNECLKYDNEEHLLFTKFIITKDDGMKYLDYDKMKQFEDSVSYIFNEQCMGFMDVSIEFNNHHSSSLCILRSRLSNLIWCNITTPLNL